MNLAATSAMRWLADTGDPFGPVQQDPDTVRDAACKLVVPNIACGPRTTNPPASHPSSVASGASVMNAILWVLLVAGIVALLAIVAMALLRWSPAAHRGRTRRRTRRTAQDADVETLVETAIDPTRDPPSWRDEADAHRRAGRYRDALRCRYRALVGDLARRGLIDEIPGRTTGEERRQLDGVAPVASVPFRSAADLFDDAWYGDAPVGDGDVDTMVALERDVLVATAGDERSTAR